MGSYEYSRSWESGRSLRWSPVVTRLRLATETQCRRPGEVGKGRRL